MILNKAFVILFFVFISRSSFALPNPNPIPGGLALIPLSNHGTVIPKAFYKKKRLAILNEQSKYYVLVGIPLGTPSGKQHIVLRWPDGKKESRSFQVGSKTYETQYLTIKNKRKVNPNKQDMKRIVKERDIKRRARTFWSDGKVKTDFAIPVEGRISGTFGLRRFFNQQPRSPHSGLDIAAPEGTPIKAVEAGTVIEASNFFFSGNVVYIDHGQGLISMYAHMHAIDVEVGQEVAKGQIIGSVGQTGRVTGAHLHLGIIANQTLVDPALLLPMTKPAGEAR